jgi:hypothetical protein
MLQDGPRLKSKSSSPVSRSGNKTAIRAAQLSFAIVAVVKMRGASKGNEQVERREKIERAVTLVML